LHKDQLLITGTGNVYGAVGSSIATTHFNAPFTNIENALPKESSS